MKKFLYLILLISIFLSSVASCSAEYFSDIIITSPNGIWTDTRTYSSLQDAITAVGSDDREIVIPNEQFVTTLTIPSNVRLKFLRDGSINNSGQLTINTTNISAENRQIFTGTGDIDFADGSIVKSSWFSTIGNAIDITEDDTVTLEITESYTISENTSIGNDVHLRWNSPNIITISFGYTLSNINSIEAGKFQIFSGAGDFDFVDGARLNSAWFLHLRSLLTYAGDANVEIEISKEEVIDYNTTIAENISLNITNGGKLSPEAGVTVTINGPFKAGLYQVIDGAGLVTLSESATKLIFPQWRGGDTYFSIIDLIDPTDPQDAATKNYVDTCIAWLGGWAKIDLGNIVKIGLNDDENPVIPCGDAYDSDRYIRETGNVLYEPLESSRKYKTFYTGYNVNRSVDEKIHYAYSEDGRSWTKSTSNPVISNRRAEDPYVVEDGGIYYLYAEDKEAGGDIYIRRWYSADCESWTDEGQITGITNCQSPTVWIEGAVWYMLYERYPIHADVALATSTDGLAWTDSVSNPVFEATDTNWVTGDIVPDSIIKKGTVYYLFYHGHDGASFKTGVATSSTLTSWSDSIRNPINPVEHGVNKIISASVFYDTEDVFLYWPRFDEASDNIGIYRGYPITQEFLYNIVEDITPQLGGDLDLNSYNIVGDGIIDLPDGQVIKLGDDDDMCFGNSLIEGNNWNNISLYGSNHFSIYDAVEGEAMIGAYRDGGVYLYCDGDRRFNTSADGSEVNGTLTLNSTNDNLIFGEQTIEGGQWSAIGLTGMNNFSIYNLSDGEAMIGAYQNGGVYLYHDGDRRLSTSLEGIVVNGTITASCGVLTCGGGGGGDGNLTAVVDDLSPQLGGDLDLNNFDIIGTGTIDLEEGERILLGTNDDMRLGHGTVDGGTWNNISLYGADDFALYDMTNDKAMIGAYRNGGVFLYHSGNRILEVTASGITVSGNVTADCGVLSCGAGGGGDNLTAVVDDLSPQLGGDLDLNNFDITGTGTIDLGDGEVILLGADDDIRLGNSVVGGGTFNNISLYGLDNFAIYDATNDKAMIGAYRGVGPYGIVLYYNGINTLATTANGATLVGDLTVSGYVDGKDISSFGSSVYRNAEDTLTNGSNLPDGAAIIAYGDANWGGGGGGIDNVVEDLTPELGGNLYTNTYEIVYNNNKALLWKNAGGSNRVGMLLDSSNDWQIGRDCNYVKIGQGSAYSNPIIIKVNGSDLQVTRSSSVDHEGKHFLVVP
jgi:beta-1,2-mannobiose phosphorylase / 1,2-beta-oligomannan phosphorylase